MPGKIARSPPRPPFGLAEVPVTVGISRLSCGNAVKREYSRQFGSHPGNPGLISHADAARGNCLPNIFRLQCYSCL
jgi:hypothetical protein